MRIAIHQPNYLPWCGYFYKMAAVDLFVILDDCKFSKSSVTHRVRIRGPHGPEWLTVPVGKKEVSLIQLKPDRSQPWGRKHWNLLQASYGKAAFWADVAEWLKPIMTGDWDTLVELNLEGIGRIARYLGIHTPLVRTSELPDGIRGSLGTGPERNLNICRHFGASGYVSGQGARNRNYYDEDAFAAAGIRIEYVDFRQPTHRQLGEGFIPGLSAVDLLFNCGPESRRILMTQP